MEVAYQILAGVAVFIMIRLALLSSKDCTALEAEYQRLRRELGGSA